MEKQKNFCPVFVRLKQLAVEKKLNFENTVLNKTFCPLAQACLGIIDSNQYNLLVEKCQIPKKVEPFYQRISIEQKINNHPKIPLEDFYQRLEKSLQLINR